MIFNVNKNEILYKLGVKINDLISRNSTKEFWGLGTINNTLYQEWKTTNEIGIRVINAYEHEIFNAKK